LGGVARTIKFCPCEGEQPPASALSVGREVKSHFEEREEFDMGRYLLLWLIGVPLPILLLIWVFGGLH
jgi:hypothetical protein